MSRLLSVLLLVFGIMFAIPSAAQQELFGTPHDTSDAGKWVVKYLGGENPGDGSLNKDFDWKAQRSYNSNGILDTDGYNRAFAIGEIPWDPDLPWISHASDTLGPNGFYSYAMTFTDDFSGRIATGETISFTELRLGYGADDYLWAIVINGVEYADFEPSGGGEFWQGYIDIVLTSSDVYWNVNGPNTIELVIANSWSDRANPTGLAATVQAVYQTSAIPEPSILLLWSAGGLVLAGTFGLRKRRMKKLAHS